MRAHDAHAHAQPRVHTRAAIPAKHSTHTPTSARTRPHARAHTHAPRSTDTLRPKMALSWASLVGPHPLQRVALLRQRVLLRCNASLRNASRCTAGTIVAARSGEPDRSRSSTSTTACSSLPQTRPSRSATPGGGSCPNARAHTHAHARARALSLTRALTHATTRGRIASRGSVLFDLGANI